MCQEDKSKNLSLFLIKLIVESVAYICLQVCFSHFEGRNRQNSHQLKVAKWHRMAPAVRQGSTQPGAHGESALPLSCVGTQIINECSESLLPHL